MSRRALARDHPSFEQLSPEVGVLDEAAFEALAGEAPDEALALLADLTAATDPLLRELARRLAGRVALRFAARPGTGPRRGMAGRLRVRPWRDGAGDLDLDASLDVLVRVHSGQPASLEEAAAQVWVPHSLALALVVDRSGSMGGERLAVAALAAAAVAHRAPTDCSVAAFSDEVLVLRSQGEARPAEEVVTDLLALRGHGTTDLAGGVRAAQHQLERSTAARKVTLLLSDCRATAGGDAAVAAAALDELIVLAPAADPADAEALARATGARCVLIGGPSTVPLALAAALSDAG